MAHVLSVHPMLPSAVGRHAQWCAEIRARRPEFATSRTAAGITRQVCWSQPSQCLAVVRTDGADPERSIEELAVATTSEFDRWYRSMELAVHGAPLREAGTAELLSEYPATSVDPFDVFVTAAVPLLPGRTGEFCRRIAHSVATGDGRERVQRWGLTHMAVWVQRCPKGPARDAFDAVIYELSGDVPGMLRQLATSDDANMRGQRALARDCFGLDWSTDPFPLPEPAFSWSADSIV
jgi:hypothetical protein